MISSVCASDSFENGTGNFVQLSDEIDDSNQHINLTKDYSKDVNETAINLDKSLTINGNNHTIHSEDSINFEMEGDADVVFNNVNFKSNSLFFTSANFSNFSINFVNCTFPLLNIVQDDLYSCDYGSTWGFGVSCEISPEVQELAFLIVGNSTDLEAAEKLTIWVQKNIKYEKKAGFYQTPTETIYRGVGNCCCQVDLLIQMMDVIGLTKNHTICYIHVGTNSFGKRHFFGMIDNFCFDPTLSSSWGRGGFWNRSAIFTQYPILPLPYGEYK